MRKIVWAAPALQDLNAIHCFIARDSEHYALSFLEELVSQPEKLVEFPEVGRIVPEYELKDIRELIFQNYRLIYKVEDLLIIILAVVHVRRDIATSE